jgi:hypothetical protein
LELEDKSFRKKWRKNKKQWKEHSRALEPQ